MVGSSRLVPPQPFQFKNPDSWSKWKRRFQQYRLVSGLTAQGADQQVSTLLYCMGEEAEDVLNSTNITTEERKVFDEVVKAFDGFFQIRVNVILPKGGQEIIAALHNLVELANTANMLSIGCRN